MKHDLFLTMEQIDEAWKDSLHYMTLEQLDIAMAHEENNFCEDMMGSYERQQLIIKEKWRRQE